MQTIATLIAFRYFARSSDTAVYDLVNCLESVIQSANKLSMLSNDYISKICVVDDHSKGEFIHLIPKNILNEIRIINNEDLLGQGNALNFGLNIVKADLYAFTDSDCIVDIDWLSNITEFLKLNPNRSCVVGPNWIHQNATNKWQRYITENESKLMKYIFESYLDSSKRSSLRIDCRNLAIHSSILEGNSRNKLFSDNVYSNSSQTSYIWRRSVINMSLIVGFDCKLIVHHKHIPSLKNHLKKYFLRGKYGGFKSIYLGNFNSLEIAFFRYYFKRHFISPVFQTSVSLVYLWLVHGAFWFGIACSKTTDGTSIPESLPFKN